MKYLQVEEANHKFLYNTLLGAFSAKVKSVVGTEIQSVVAAQSSLLKDKISERLADEFKVPGKLAGAQVSGKAMSVLLPTEIPASKESAEDRYKDLKKRVLSSPWATYLQAAHTFHSGDALLSAEDQASQKDEILLRFKLKDEGNDLVVKKECYNKVLWQTMCTSSLENEEVRLLPSITSETGNAICLIGRISVPVGDKEKKIVIQQSVLNIVSKFGKRGIEYVQRTFSGVHCLAETVRFYTFDAELPEAEVEQGSEPHRREVVKAMTQHLLKSWVHVLYRATTCDPGDEGKVISALMDEVYQVPGWLLDRTTRRRAQFIADDDDVLLQILVFAGDDMADVSGWGVVQSFSLHRNEFIVAPHPASKNGDMIQIKFRGLHGADSSRLYITASPFRPALVEAWGCRVATYAAPAAAEGEPEPEPEAEPAVEAEIEAGFVDWCRVFSDTAGKADDPIAQAMYTASSLKQYLVDSKWAQYLARPRIFKRGDEVPDEIAKGTDGKTVAAKVIALAAPVS